MDHDHFVGQVQAHTKLSSNGQAEAATRAALETLDLFESGSRGELRA